MTPKGYGYAVQSQVEMIMLHWTHVKQWLGYEKLDIMAVVPLLDDLYRTGWRLFHKLFCPSVKFISKERIGSKTVKRHDSPKTPYQRIMESPHISPHQRD